MDRVGCLKILSIRLRRICQFVSAVTTYLETTKKQTFRKEKPRIPFLQTLIPNAHHNHIRLTKVLKSPPHPFFFAFVVVLKKDDCLKKRIFQLGRVHLTILKSCTTDHLIESFCWVITSKSFADHRFWQRLLALKHLVSSRT